MAIYNERLGRFMDGQSYNLVIDVHPEDQILRRAYGEYLQHTNHILAAGYLALAALDLRPLHRPGRGSYGAEAKNPGTFEWCLGPSVDRAGLPREWFGAITAPYDHGTMKSFPSRRAAEDAAALAFVCLSPEVQQKILPTPIAVPTPSETAITVDALVRVTARLWELSTDPKADTRLSDHDLRCFRGAAKALLAPDQPHFSAPPITAVSHLLRVTKPLDRGWDRYAGTRVGDWPAQPLIAFLTDPTIRNRVRAERERKAAEALSKAEPVPPTFARDPRESLKGLAAFGAREAQVVEFLDRNRTRVTVLFQTKEECIDVSNYLYWTVRDEGEIKRHLTVIENNLPAPPSYTPDVCRRLGEKSTGTWEPVDFFTVLFHPDAFRTTVASIRFTVGLAPVPVLEPPPPKAEPKPEKWSPPLKVAEALRHYFGWDLTKARELTLPKEVYDYVETLRRDREARERHRVWLRDLDPNGPTTTAPRVNDDRIRGNLAGRGHGWFADHEDPAQKATVPPKWSPPPAVEGAVRAWAGMEVDDKNWAALSQAVSSQQLNEVIHFVDKLRAESGLRTEYDCWASSADAPVPRLKQFEVDSDRYGRTRTSGTAGWFTRLIAAYLLVPAIRNLYAEPIKRDVPHKITVDVSLCLARPNRSELLPTPTILPSAEWAALRPAVATHEGRAGRLHVTVDGLHYVVELFDVVKSLIPFFKEENPK